MNRKDKTLRVTAIVTYGILALIAFLINIRYHSNISHMILLLSWMVNLYLLFDIVFDFQRKRFDFSKGQRKYFNSMLWSFIVSIMLSLLEFKETSMGLTLLSRYLPLVSHLLNLYIVALFFRAGSRKEE